MHGFLGACPLQLAVAHLSAADWFLRLEAGAMPAILRTADAMKQVEGTLKRAEEAMMEFAGDMSRPYFFELLAVSWPVYRLLNRVQLRMVEALGLVCTRGGIWAPGPAAGPSGSPDLRICPACQCPHQGEWVPEARFISEYSERLSELLLRRAACQASRWPEPIRQRWVRGIAMDAARTQHLRWGAFSRSQSAFSWEGAPPPLPGPFSPVRLPGEARREAFVAALFVRGSALDQVLLHVEAIRVLAFSTRVHSLRSRPFLVVTDGLLPPEASQGLEADGITLLELRNDDLSFARTNAYGASEEGDLAKLQLASWWLERGVAPTAVKLAIWNLTAYDCLVFLDADTLLMDSVDELFEMETFASGLNPYSTHGMTHNGEKFANPGINTGVMVLQPSEEVAVAMAQEMAAGIHDNSPIAGHLGQSDQPWLDAFWLARSPRLGVARFAGRRPSWRRGSAVERGRHFAGCDAKWKAAWGETSELTEPPCEVRPETMARLGARRACLRQRQRRRGRPREIKPIRIRPSGPGAAHCVLPVEYDFFADYKALRTNIWFENRGRDREGQKEIPWLANMSDIEYALRRYLDSYDVMDGGVYTHIYIYIYIGMSHVRLVGKGLDSAVP